MVALAIAVLIGWQLWYPAQMEKARKTQEPVKVAAPAAPSPGATPAAGTDPGAKPSAPVVQPESQSAAAPVAGTAAVSEKKTQILESEEAQWLFSNVGAGVERVTLKRHQSEEGSVVMNLFGSVPIGALTETFENPVLEPFSMEVGADSKSIVFRRTDVRQLEVEKRFALPVAGGAGKPPSAFEVDLEVTFRNHSASPLSVPNYALRLGSCAALHSRDLPIYTGFNRSIGGDAKFTDVTWFEGGGFLGFGKKSRPLYSETGAVGWAGVTNQYYCTLITPKGVPFSVSEALARRFVVSTEDWIAAGRGAVAGSSIHAVDGALRMSQISLAPGQESKSQFRIFVGPREHRLLSALGGDQDQMLDFGMFGIVSRSLLASMNGLKSLVGSYAAAIVVLTIIIKLLMWPLQNKATKSMKRMQELQPKMNEIKERYGDDPQRMNVEIMALYKKHGVNPMSGCAPMLIQIPIFFGFYNMLGKAVELRNSSFLWVKDLSQPDTVAMLAGYPINVLPLLMAVTMLWQMQLSPKTGDPMQQRMFMFMPLIFILFCYNFASALALYWTVQNLFSIVQLTVTNSRERKSGLQSAVASPKRAK